MNQDPATEETENHYRSLQAKVADAVRLETLTVELSKLFMDTFFLDSRPLYVGDDDLHHLVFSRLCPTGK